MDKNGPLGIKEAQSIYESFLIKHEHFLHNLCILCWQQWCQEEFKQHFYFYKLHMELLREPHICFFPLSIFPLSILQG
jgi:hypothetical protein